MYSPEFRERAVRVARESKRPIAAVARDLGIQHETLRVWVCQDEANDGSRRDRLASAEREELTSRSRPRPSVLNSSTCSMTTNRRRREAIKLRQRMNHDR